MKIIFKLEKYSATESGNFRNKPFSTETEEIEGVKSNEI